MCHLRFVAETYSKEDLARRILDGVPVVPKADPNGPNPPLGMPPYRSTIRFEEMQQLVNYLYSFRPPGETKAAESPIPNIARYHPPPSVA